MVKSNDQAEPQDDIKFLREYLRRLQEWYQDSSELLPEELPPTPKRIIEWDNEAERVARLADANGFDGAMFRDYLLDAPDEDPLSVVAMRRIRKKVELIPRIIAKLEQAKCADSRSSIPSEAKLLTVAQAAKMLSCGQSVLRDRDRKGLVPRPIRVGGSIRWNADELQAWIKHNCPARAEWERNRETWMQEVNDATA